MDQVLRGRLVGGNVAARGIQIGTRTDRRLRLLLGHAYFAVDLRVAR